MTARSPSAFMLSAALHALVAVLLLLVAYATSKSASDVPKVFELVAGEGDNYGAKVAPALGVEGGVKLDLAAPPAPRPEPPKPIEPKVVEPTPVQPAPPPEKTAVTKAAPPPAPNFVRRLKNQLVRADSKAKKEIAKERAAEEKRRLEDARRLTKEEFDKMNKAKSAPGSKSPTKIARLDPEGIAKGVYGGSTENKTGGAGGTALRREEGDVLDMYYSLFRQRLKTNFEMPPGLSDTLVVTVRVQSAIDGTLSNPRIITSSGSAEFDRAVLAAIRKTRMPVRPDGRSEQFEFSFTLREKEEG